MKTHFKISIFLILTGLSFVTKSQQSNYNLRNYKNPNYKYKSLDLRFNFASPFSSFDSEDIGYGKGHTFSFRSNINCLYHRYSNSENFQGEQQLNSGFDTDISQSKSNRNSFLQKNNSQSGSFYLNTKLINRFYISSQRFIEIDPIIGLSTGLSNNKLTRLGIAPVDQFEQNKSTSLSTSISIPVLIGNGRIEQVQDAQLAMYILEDLQKSGLLKEQIQDNQVEILAMQLTKLKYKRNFDNRLQKIAEMNSLDSLIHKLNLVSDHGVALFTILRDNMDYANNPVRESGTRYYLALKPKLNYIFNSSHYKAGENEDYIGADVKQESKNNRISVGFCSGIVQEKPISRTIQQSLFAEVNASYISLIDKLTSPANTDNRDIKASVFPSIDIQSGIAYGYYPNSRTWLTAGWSVYTGYFYTNQEINGIHQNTNNLYIYTGPTLNAYFYLSPKMRLNLHFVGEFRNDNKNLMPSSNKQTELWWNQQVEASLTYSIF